MCLGINENSAKKAVELRKKSGYRVYWKVITLFRRPEKYLRSILHGYRWKPGWNKSNRYTGTYVTNNEIIKGIDRGIHVCMTRKAAREWTTDGDRIVKVICYNKDCVAFDSLSPQAVYTKVFLARDEYKNALKRKSIERKK